MAVLWFLSGMQAYLTVRPGNIVSHRRWMIRNFALTLAAVTLGMYLPLMLFLLHWSFRTSYITVAMLGSELACRRVDGAKAVACSGVNGPPSAIRLSLFNHVSTFRAFFYAAFLLEVFTKRERNLYAALRHPISRG
jgi:hypothetical protein